MTADKPLLGAEMTRMAFIFLLLSNAASVSTQFNGYNCDANYHSRFPGENPPQQVLSFAVHTHLPTGVEHGRSLSSKSSSHITMSTNSSGRLMLFFLLMVFLITFISLLRVHIEDNKVISLYL